MFIKIKKYFYSNFHNFKFNLIQAPLLGTVSKVSQENLPGYLMVMFSGVLIRCGWSQAMGFQSIQALQEEPRMAPGLLDWQFKYVHRVFC